MVPNETQICDAFVKTQKSTQNQLQISNKKLTYYL